MSGPTIVLPGSSGCKKGGVPDHEKHTNLFGGNASGHWHLTEQQHEQVDDLLDQCDKIMALVEDSRDINKLLANIQAIEELIAVADKLKELAEKSKELLELLEQPSCSKEKPYSVTLTAGDVANRYIELPEDCDGEQAISVVYGGIVQERNKDWVLMEFNAPQKDRISWAGLDMGDLVQAGDTMSITYYVKG